MTAKPNMPKARAQRLWNEFSQTGRIGAYLTYRAALGSGTDPHGGAPTSL